LAEYEISAVAVPRLDIDGTESDDVLIGDTNNDLLDGLGGDDTIFGDEGNDRIDGGIGEDSLFGDGGNDTLLGQFGDDMGREMTLLQVMMVTILYSGKAILRRRHPTLL